MINPSSAIVRVKFFIFNNNEELEGLLFQVIALYSKVFNFLSFIIFKKSHLNLKKTSKSNLA